MILNLNTNNNWHSINVRITTICYDVNRMSIIVLIIVQPTAK